MIEIRLLGDPDEVTDATELVRDVFRVDHVSDPVRNRRGAGVRVYVDASVPDMPLVVAPPPPRVVLVGPEAVLVEQVQATDRVRTRQGWQRVVHTSAAGGSVFVFTVPDVPARMWTFTPGDVLTRHRIVEGPEL